MIGALLLLGESTVPQRLAGCSALSQCLVLLVLGQHCFSLAASVLFHVLLLVGTWPALLNLCERKGRHPAHTFLDVSC